MTSDSLLLLLHALAHVCRSATTVVSAPLPLYRVPRIQLWPSGLCGKCLPTEPPCGPCLLPLFQTRSHTGRLADRSFQAAVSPSPSHVRGSLCAPQGTSTGPGDLSSTRAWKTELSLPTEPSPLPSTHNSPFLSLPFSVLCPLRSVPVCPPLPLLSFPFPQITLPYTRSVAWRPLRGHAGTAGQAVPTQL